MSLALVEPPARREVDFAALAEVAERIVRAPEFVPVAFRNSPDRVLAALLTGAELGLGPMASLRSIHVIEGRPTLSAEAMRALVLAAGHELYVDRLDDTRCEIRGRRRGGEWSNPVVWSMDMARKARLAGRGAWQTYPRSMLLARASTELCRMLFPDVIGGLEVAELIDDEANRSTTSKRAPKSHVPPESDVPPVEPPATLPPKPLDEPSGTRGAGDAPTAVRGRTAGRVPRGRKPAADEGVPVDDERAGASPPAEGRRTDGPDEGAGVSPPHHGSDAPVGTLLDEPELFPETAPPSSDEPAADMPGDMPPPPDESSAPAALASDTERDRRALHAQVADTFPEHPPEARDLFRHALVAVVTRSRPSGSVMSSSELEPAERMAFMQRLDEIRSGAMLASVRADLVVELAAGPWRYVVDLARPRTEMVTVTDTRRGSGE